MNELPDPATIRRIPPEGGDGFNRLVHETSPYLLQHCRNPVDWYPWGEAAFAQARAEEKPIFLSIGYASCHWCHVMERESFANPAIAEILNRRFVSIKVDREERPDVDEVYMTATQLVSGQGGWPNSLFLLPDRRPFFAGTYFPPEDRWGRPGFPTLLLGLAEAWQRRRGDIERQAETLTEEMRRAGDRFIAPGETRPDRALVDAVVESLRETFDARHGGFGAAPKFPPHGALELLLYERRQRPDPDLDAMITTTLDAMARGGIHDHLGGGFARYATDDEWFVPHFEKMLTDNAQLLRVYALAAAAFKREEYRRAARGIVAWLDREMFLAEGGAATALDADSEGEEGRYYLWTIEEIKETLGANQADANLAEFAIDSFGLEPGGNFIEPHSGATGRNILRLAAAPTTLATRAGIDEETFWSRFDRIRRLLADRRNTRPPPFRDDKVLASANGLLIGALASGGVALEEPGWIERARRLAEFAARTFMRNGKVIPSWRGRPSINPPLLDDVAFLAWGFGELGKVPGHEAFLEQRRFLARSLLDAFEDPAAGGFFLTPRDAEELIFRPRDPFDKATPSGNAIAARVLLDLADPDEPADAWRQAAERTLALLAPLLAHAPQAMPHLALTLAMTLER